MDTNLEHPAINTLTMDLMHAALNHQLKTVKELIATPGISLREVNQNGDTALMLAAQNNPLEWTIEDRFPVETIMVLLSHPGIQVNAVNKKTGNSALMLGVLSGEVDIVKALLTTPNIQLNLRNRKGETAFMLAKKYDHLDIAALLIQAGAKIPLKLKIKQVRQKISTSIKNLYAEFKKHPTYYLFSGATRLALGALVGYGLFNGLTTLAAPYLVPNIGSLLPSLLPKAIATFSTISAAIASIKLANHLLTRLFGEHKLVIGSLVPNPASPDKVDLKCDITKTKGILALCGQDRPYKTTLFEIVSNLEQEFTFNNKDNPDLLTKRNIFALAYAKQIVESEAGQKFFDSSAKAEVNTEPYISAAVKMK